MNNWKFEYYPSVQSCLWEDSAVPFLSSHKTNIYFEELKYLFWAIRPAVATITSGKSLVAVDFLSCPFFYWKSSRFLWISFFHLVSTCPWYKNVGSDRKSSPRIFISLEYSVLPKILHKRSIDLKYSKPIYLKLTYEI